MQPRNCECVNPECPREMSNGSGISNEIFSFSVSRQRFFDSFHGSLDSAVPSEPHLWFLHSLTHADRIPMEMLRNCFHPMPGPASQKPPIALVIPFITKYHLSPITPGNDVIEGSWKMNPRLSCHTEWIPTARSNVNTYILMHDTFLFLLR